MNDTSRSSRRGGWLSSVAGIAAIAALLVAITAPAATPAPAQSKCGICGKNLIKNPGADAGFGVTAVDAKGAVPGWTIEAGQFGAASYTFPNGWFSARSKGPAKRGKNYFFGGTTREAVEAPASVGKQTIALPRAAVGRKATLSGWLGNYGENRTQVRAEFMDASGAVLSTVRIGPAVTIAGTDMGFRTRNGKVPAKTTQATISVIFSGGGANYKLAGADSLSLVLA
jgi:hypothetical protein